MNEEKLIEELKETIDLQEEKKSILTKEVTTPAGNRFTIRRMKVKDEDIITDPELARDGENLPAFLMSITGMSRDRFDNLLNGEIFYLAIQIRIFSKGTTYETRVTNPNGRLIDVNIDLSKLEVQKLDKKLSDEKYEFTICLPVSKDVILGRLLKGSDNKNLDYIRKKYPNQFSSHLLMMQTKEINKTPISSVEYFEEMDSEDSEFIRREFQKRDCGYDTEIIVYDRDSMSDMAIELPFDSSFFLGITKRKKGTNKKY